MEAERWKTIERLCNEALDRSEDQRDAFLKSACTGDESLLREIESLLAQQKHANNFIEIPALDQAAHVLSESQRQSPRADAAPRMIGRVVSHYRIVERIGYGGMGDVYRAVRADDQYQKLVALKLVRTDFDTESILERFKNERQILAGLEHPNVARLIDGGTTDDGLPYFVLELVDGEPIDRYCDSHRLSTVQRLELFRGVCSAVHYAHQHLVVHRDIKPGNILVTPEGVPKLLDFGIAKITDPANFPRAVEATATAMHVMTPEYASPEQVRGESITTASDVYSLGVLLYYLLTGHLPYRLQSHAPHEVARAICEIDPEKPSAAVNRVEQVAGPDGLLIKLTAELVSCTREGQPEKLRSRLRGDLDHIVLKAICKEPARRYTSVEQLSEDIGRYLEGRIVLARESTFPYRAAKFVRRHKAAFIATALVSLTLIAGVIAIVRESQLERSQRARAERRFNDVRKLANSLFDIHDDIANLPGTVVARKKIVSTSLTYLDSLANESSGDSSLQEELIDAYERVGDIQGRPGTENLGDTAGALASFRKAEQVSLSLVKADPKNSDYKFTLGGVYWRLGHLLASMGNYSVAMQEDRKALDTWGELARSNPNDARLQNVAGIAYLNMAQHQDLTGEFQASIENFGRAAAIYIKTRESTDPKRAHNAVYNLGVTYIWLAQTLRDQGDYATALEYDEKSLEIRKTILQRNPKNVRAQLDLADTYTGLGDVLWRKGEPTKALTAARQSQAIAEAAAAADPNDQRAKECSADAYYVLGEVFRLQKNFARALDFANRIVKIDADLNTKDPNNIDLKGQMGQAYCLLGDVYQARAMKAPADAPSRSSDFKEALASYQKALDIDTKLHQEGSLPYFQNAEIERIPREIQRCSNLAGKK